MKEEVVCMFVAQVATKRVKHAIKSDIPSVGDNISKLVHIGKATVDKLMDLRASFQEEGEHRKKSDNRRSCETSCAVRNACQFIRSKNGDH